MAELIERAEGYAARLARGEVATRADLARQEGVTRARVTQVMGLLKLAAGIRDRVRAGVERSGGGIVTERCLRLIAALPPARQEEWARTNLVRPTNTSNPGDGSPSTAFAGA